MCFLMQNRANLKVSLSGLLELKNSSYCKFGNNIESKVRDKSTFGLKKCRMLDKLLKENEKLTLNKACDVAVTLKISCKRPASSKFNVYSAGVNGGSSAAANPNVADIKTEPADNTTNTGSIFKSFENGAESKTRKEEKCVQKVQEATWR